VPLFPKAALMPVKSASIPPQRSILSMALLWVSLLAYAGSLALPAYLTDTDTLGRRLEHYGLEAFLLGPIGIVGGQVSWLANPLLLVAWVKRAQAHPWPSFYFAVVALCLALSFLAGSTVPVGSAGIYRYYGAIGFYVWVGSIVFAAASALALAAAQPDEQSTSHTS